MADLYCLEITSATEQAELLSAALALEVPQGWEEAETSGGMLARVHSRSRDFCLELAARLKELSPDWAITCSNVAETDWLSAWKEFFTPVEAGSRFLVLAPWMEEERKNTRRQALLIEPKTAFGTGHHASTALCLRAISDLVDAGRLKAGGRFLDLGTGSGILGLGAALLGLRGLGLDTDPQAVENALENRALNRVAPESFEVRRGSLEAAPETAFDLITANILAEPLCELAGPLSAKLKSGGALVLSGILATQAGQVEAAYSPYGLGPAVISTQDEWISVLYVR